MLQCFSNGLEHIKLKMNSRSSQHHVEWWLSLHFLFSECSIITTAVTFMVCTCVCLCAYWFCTICFKSAVCVRESVCACACACVCGCYAVVLFSSLLKQVKGSELFLFEEGPLILIQIMVNMRRKDIYVYAGMGVFFFFHVSAFHCIFV